MKKDSDYIAEVSRQLPSPSPDIVIYEILVEPLEEEDDESAAA